MSPAVELIQVSKVYASHTVLMGLNLKIETGRRVALAGPSGAGKSTVLKLIAGIVTPTSGKVIRHTRRTGYVFQEPRLLPWNTALENVTLPLLAKGINKKEANKRGMACLDDMGLTGFATNLPDQLSGGMKQRVSIARALAIEPDLLLLDEPFTGLDPELRESICAGLESALQNRDTTVIHVTHDIQNMIHTADTLYTLTAPDTLLHECTPKAPVQSFPPLKMLVMPNNT